MQTAKNGFNHDLLLKVADDPSNVDWAIYEEAVKKFKCIKENHFDPDEVFYTICFVLCVPQARFENTVKAIQSLKTLGFYEAKEDSISIDTIHNIIKPCRFHVRKASNLLAMKKNFPRIFTILKSNRTNHEKREWLVNNVKGLGMKTASHLLRNFGDKDLAIIDSHVMKHLGYSEKSPKNRDEYVKIEKEYRSCAEALNVSMATYDCWVWCLRADVSPNDIF